MAFFFHGLSQASRYSCIFSVLLYQLISIHIWNLLMNIDIFRWFLLLKKNKTFNLFITTMELISNFLVLRGIYGGSRL